MRAHGAVEVLGVSVDMVEEAEVEVEEEMDMTEAASDVEEDPEGWEVPVASVDERDVVERGPDPAPALAVCELGPAMPYSDNTSLPCCLRVQYPTSRPAACIACNLRDAVRLTSVSVPAGRAAAVCSSDRLYRYPRSGQLSPSSFSFPSRQGSIDS